MQRNDGLFALGFLVAHILDAAVGLCCIGFLRGKSCFLIVEHAKPISGRLYMAESS